MKLLGWIHRKVRQNDARDRFKDHIGGGGGSTCNCLSGRSSFEEYRHSYSSNKQLKTMDAINVDQELFNDDKFTAPLTFDSFLTIGTLGFSPIEEKAEEEKDEYEEEVQQAPPPPLQSPPQPAMMVEEIAGKQAEAMTTEDILAVGAELEKVLTAEAEKSGDVRLSLSAAKSSSAGSECPLQEYLFGSPMAAAAGRKERRASLGELFMRSRIVEEEKEEGFDVKKKKKAKMLMRRRSSENVGGGNGCGGDGESSGAAATNKLNKILQILHRKIHPESSLEAKKAAKMTKHKNKDFKHCERSPNLQVKTPVSTSNTCKKEKHPSCKNHSENSIALFEHGDANGKHGHWIKTDADYVVLEL